MSEFDVSAIRAQFPILNREVNGRPLVFLDSAASAQKPDAVIDAMASQARTAYANVHRGLHTLANETTAAFEGAREDVRRFLNAASTDEIVFTKGATEAINLVASSFGDTFKEGDEIVLSVMEHHSNIVPWHFLRERKGVVLKWIDVDEAGELDMDQLAKAITSRTRLVTIAHMSNVLGTAPDVSKVIRLAHDLGAAVMLDGCQGAVHLDVDVQALDVDFYAFSAHKLYGPTGVGALYAKHSLLENMQPYQGGGEMILDVSQDRVTYNDAPHRFEAGTPPILEAVGFGAAIRWVEGLDASAATEHKLAVYNRMVEGVRSINELRIHGTTVGKGPVLSFSIEGLHPHDIAQILDRYGVAIRAGHHCAQPLMKALGVSATARASIGVYNTMEEADQFVEALGKARAMLAG